MATGSPAALACKRVTLGPRLRPIHNSAVAAKPASTVRPLPRRPKAQISQASATSISSSAAAPLMPLCWPSTHNSHTTVANMGKAMNWRKVTIHAPGRGSARATAGHQLAAK